MPQCPVTRIGHSIDHYNLLVQSYNEEINETSDELSEESNYLTTLNKIDVAQLSSVIRGTWENKYGEKMMNKWPNLCTEHIKLDYSKSRFNNPFIEECTTIINTHTNNLDHHLKYMKLDYIIMYGGIIFDTNNTSISSPIYQNGGVSQTSVDTFLKASNWTACDQLFFCSLQNYRQSWQALEFEHGLNARAFHSTCVIYALRGIPLIFLFGGLIAKDKFADNKLYYMQLFNDPKSFTKWSELHTDNPKPSPRYGHTLRCVTHYLVLFGGIANNELCNDVWILNLRNISLRNNKWEKIYFPGLTPAPRSFHSAISVGKTKYSMLIYGGITKLMNKNRIYALCITMDGKWIWKIFPLIVKFTHDIRAFHTMHVIDNNVVIIGGEDYSRERSIGLHVLIYCMREKTFFYRNQTMPMAGHASWVTNSLVHFFGGFTEMGISPLGIVTCNPLSYTTNNMAFVHYFRLNDAEEDENKEKVGDKESENILGRMVINNSDQEATLDPVLSMQIAYAEPVLTYISRPQRSSAFKAMQAIKEDMEVHKRAEDNKEPMA